MNFYITFFEIAAFLASLAAWPMIRRSSYLRLFPFLLFVIVSVEVYEAFLRSKNENTWVYNIQIPIQYLFYLAILYFSFEKKEYREIIILFSVIFVLFTFFSAIKLTPPAHLNTYSYCLGSLFIIIGIILKFYEILKDPTHFDFLKNPYFYILFAYLLFNVGTLPYFSMGYWLYYKMGYVNAVKILNNVVSVLNYVLYGTYTLAFLWIIRMKVYS
jgi:hypothetical protein